MNPKDKGNALATSKTVSKQTTTQSVSVSNLTTNNACNSISLLPTANICISTENKTKNCKSLFDTGSMSTFVIREVVNELNIQKTSSITLAVDGFDSVGKSKTYDIVTLNISTNDGIIPINAIVVDSLANRIVMSGRKHVVEQLSQSHRNLADSSLYDRIECLHVLIGMDNFFKFLYGTRIKDDLFELPSKLGTIVLGTFASSVPSVCNVTTMLRVGLESESIDDLWKLDAIGIKDTDCQGWAVFKYFSI